MRTRSTVMKMCELGRAKVRCQERSMPSHRKHVGACDAFAIDSDLSYTNGMSHHECLYRNTAQDSDQIFLAPITPGASRLFSQAILIIFTRTRLF